MLWRAVVVFGLSACGRLDFASILNAPPDAEDGTLALGQSISGTLRATDAEGDPLTFSIVAAPAKGTLAVDAATGAYTYTAARDTTGTDSFTFQARDREAVSNVATVAVSLSAWGWTGVVGGAGNQFAQAVATDTSDNAIITGYSDASIDGLPYVGGQDVFVAKFDHDANRLWTAMRGGPGDQVSYGAATDAAGNIYVCGTTNGVVDGQPLGGAIDELLIKFAPDGTWLWTRTRGNAGNQVVGACGILPSGDVVLIGSTDSGFDGQPLGGSFDAFYSEWAPDGTWVTTRLYGGPGLESIQSGYVDPQGNVIGVGYSQASSTNALTVKWNAGGTFAWRGDRIGGPGALDGPAAGGAAMDAADNVYVTGYTNVGFDGQPYLGGSTDAFLLKYDPQGTWQWSTVFGGAGADSPYPHPPGVTATPSGLIVPGFTNVAFGGATLAGATDLFVTKWSFDGVRQWTELHGGAGDETTERNDSAVDSAGYVYVVGDTTGDLDGYINLGGHDAYITRWNSNR